MQTLLGFLKSVFNFFVGDWIILGGIALTVAVVAVIENVTIFDNHIVVGGYLFFIGVVLTLVATLRREVKR